MPTNGMLGPLAIGIVYVKKRHFELLRPTLLGAWNVQSPNFIAQDEIAFVPTAQRYEPGVLNISGLYGMVEALELIMSFGLENVARRLLQLKAYLIERLETLGFQILGPKEGPAASSITTFHHPTASMAKLHQTLEQAKILTSLRHDKAGQEYLRFSPHLLNTEEEIERAMQTLTRIPTS